MTADFTNVADVTAVHAAGGTVGDSDTADVTVLFPGIDIQKTPDLQTVLAGEDATFTITVANTGDVDLTEQQQSFAFTTLQQGAVLQAVASVEDRQKITPVRFLDQRRGHVAPISTSP